LRKKWNVNRNFFAKMSGLCLIRKSWEIMSQGREKQQEEFGEMR